MSKVVFDIETIGIDFDELNDDAQKYILKNADDEKKAEETTEKEKPSESESTEETK